MMGASADFARVGRETGQPVFAAPAAPDHNTPTLEVKHG